MNIREHYLKLALFHVGARLRGSEQNLSPNEYLGLCKELMNFSSMESMATLDHVSSVEGIVDFLFGGSKETTPKKQTPDHINFDDSYDSTTYLSDVIDFFSSGSQLKHLEPLTNPVVFFGTYAKILSDVKSNDVIHALAEQYYWYEDLLKKYIVMGNQFIKWANDSWTIAEHTWKDLNEFKRKLLIQLDNIPENPTFDLKITPRHTLGYGIQPTQTYEGWLSPNNHTFGHAFKPKLTLDKQASVQPINESKIKDCVTLLKNLEKYVKQYDDRGYLTQVDSHGSQFDDYPFRANEVSDLFFSEQMAFVHKEKYHHPVTLTWMGADCIYDTVETPIKALYTMMNEIGKIITTLLVKSFADVGISMEGLFIAESSEEKNNIKVTTTKANYIIEQFHKKQLTIPLMRTDSDHTGNIIGDAGRHGNLCKNLHEQYFYYFDLISRFHTAATPYLKFLKACDLDEDFKSEKQAITKLDHIYKHLPVLPNVSFHETEHYNYGYGKQMLFDFDHINTHNESLHRQTYTKGGGFFRFNVSSDVHLLIEVLEHFVKNAKSYNLQLTSDFFGGYYFDYFADFSQSVNDLSDSERLQVEHHIRQLKEGEGHRSKSGYHKDIYYVQDDAVDKYILSPNINVIKRIHELVRAIVKMLTP